MSNEKILVIDDNQEIRTYLQKKVLEPAGYVFLSASDGSEGLQRALEERPDLILLDLKLPDMYGLEILEALRDHQVEIPVILMTFYGSESIAVRAFRLGVRDYLSKPFESEEVLESISRALTESRLAQELARANDLLKQRVAELVTLHDLVKSITSISELDALLNRIVEAAIYITGADEGSLLLSDEKSGEIYMRASKTFGQRAVQNLKTRVEDTLVRNVIRTGEPIMLGDSAEDRLIKVRTGYLAKSLLYVPLKIREEVIGVLGTINVVSNYIFDQNDLRQLSTLADYVAVAIENARLREIAQKVSEHGGED